MQQFAYVATHDLRAPLTNLIGLTDIVDDENLNAENKFIFDKIKESTFRLNETLEDLIKLITLKKDELQEPVKINLEKEIGFVTESLQDVILSSKAKIKVSLKVSEIVYVKSIVKSVLQNLMTNAIKYKSENRDLVIDIKSDIVKEWIIISFKDNGRGIDLKKHGDAIFKLYKRFDDSASIEGKGIGLYLVKAQLERMGHSITVKSELDKGCEFILKIKNLNYNA